MIFLAHSLFGHEKSQIQAFDRTQPGLSIKPGRCQNVTHDYMRHGATTLFSALTVLDDTVIGRCRPFRRFPEGKVNTIWPKF